MRAEFTTAAQAAERARHRPVRWPARRVARALASLASLVAGHAHAQCGPLNAAASYPVYSASSLAIGNNSRVGNGSTYFTITGSGRALDENTGQRVNPSPAPALPTLQPAGFPANASSTDLSAGTVGAGSWRDITINSAATFTGGTYHIRKLDVKAGASVTLGAGTYYVQDFVLASNIAITLSSGPVRILIGDKVTGGNNIAINDGGSAASLQLFFYPNTRLKVGNSVRITGLVYAPYGSTTIEFGNSVGGQQIFAGAIISAGPISVGNNSDFIYPAEVESATAAISTCALATGPAGFAVEAAGGGPIGTQTRGEPFAVRVRAVTASGATDTGFTGTVTIASNCTLAAAGGTTASFVAGVLAAHPVTISNTGTCTLTATHSGGSASGTSNAFAVLAPGRFNAFDTSTASGAVAGPIRTKIAGSPFTLAVVAIDAPGTGVLTTFTGTVTVELLNAADDSGALNATTQCRSSWSAVQTVTPNPVFAAANAGRIVVTFTQANAWRAVRVRITHSNAAGTTVGCSTDAFAIRPAAFSTPVASDATDATAGTARTLDNTAATSGTVHRAGRPFTVLAQALSAGGGVTTGYTGAAPVLNVAGCLQPAGCTAGALASNLAGTGGVVTGTASYGEAGVIAAELEDLDFAAIDAADSTVAERAIRSGPVTIGRFVADRYALSLTTQPVMAPGACAAGGHQGFTFIGQPFSFATAPVLLITPLNAAGAALANARPRIEAAHLTAALVDSAAPVPLAGTPAISGIVNAATSTVTFAPSSFAFTRNPANPVAPFAASLRFDASVSDTSEAGATAPITGSLSPAAGPLAFSGGASTFHYGRALLRSTYGEQTRDLFVPLELQSFNGTGWVGLAAAGGCFSAPATVFAYSAATGALAGAGGAPNCATRLTGTVTTSGGRALIRLPAPPAGGSTTPAAMTLTLNLLAAASGQTCNGAAPAAAGTLAMPWLAAPGSGGHDANPAARVSWGRARADYLDARERFD